MGAVHRHVVLREDWRNMTLEDFKRNLTESHAQLVHAVGTKDKPDFGELIFQYLKDLGAYREAIRQSAENWREFDSPARSKASSPTVLPTVERHDVGGSKHQAQVSGSRGAVPEKLSFRSWEAERAGGCASLASMSLPKIRAS